MALIKFKAPVLPRPPINYDAMYMINIISSITKYFGLLDSKTPTVVENSQIEQSLVMGEGSTPLGIKLNCLTTTEKNALTSVGTGTLIFDTTLGKMCIYDGSAWRTVTSV